MMKLKSPVARPRELRAVLSMALFWALAGCGGSGGAVAVSSPAGQPILVNSAPEAAGSHCVAGGVRIQSGVDADANQVLDAAEVQSTSYACNGQAGATGANGTMGATGATGGDGLTSLIRSTLEPAGANCSAGGWLIQSGQDVNRNSVLDTSEIQASSYACNGSLGSTGATGLNSLMLTTSEPPSSNCGIGGLKVQTGLDTNRDGQLQPSEVTQTSYMCRLPSAAEKSWRGAASIEAGAGGANEPQIAFDTQGNAIAVWYQADGAVLNIMANRYKAGIGWGTATLIEQGANSAYLPKIAMDAQGNAIAVWLQSDGRFDRIMVNRFTPLAGWTGEVAIDTGTSDAFFHPQIAMDASGNALVVWPQRDGATLSIMANRYDAALGWGVAAPIETGAETATSPQVAMDANGNAIAVWHHRDATSFSVIANRYTAGIGWGNAQAIEASPNNAVNPQVAFDAQGRAMAIWAQFDGTDYSVMANRYTPVSGWGTASAIETRAGQALSPMLAINANGDAFAVWFQADGAIYSIMANRYTPASGWGTAELIESAAIDAFDPRIAIDKNGNALAVWMQTDGFISSIVANRYTAGVGWGVAAVIKAGAGNVLSAQLAMDPQGNAFAVWGQDGGGNDYNIMANGFY